MRGNCHDLKRLYTELKFATEELENKDITSNYGRDRYSDNLKKVTNIRKKIDNIKQSSDVPIVSEHAIIRWLERVVGIDIEQVQRDILDDKTIAAIKFAKSGTIRRGDMNIIFKNNVIVTIEN